MNYSPVRLSGLIAVELRSDSFVSSKHYDSCKEITAGCLIKHHAMKTYWRNESIAPRILDLGTR